MVENDVWQVLGQERLHVADQQLSLHQIGFFLELRREDVELRVRVSDEVQGTASGLTESCVEEAVHPA